LKRTDSIPSNSFNAEFAARAIGAYRYAFNGKELDKPGMGGGQSTYDYGFRVYNPAIAKFLSVDPHFESQPRLSSYHALNNNPNLFIDPDGRDNIIYILVTNKGKRQLKREGISAESIAKRATNFLQTNLGLKTTVKVFEGNARDFEILKMDKTDAVAVFGSDIEDTRDFIRKELDPVFADGALDKWSNSALNPERSENNPIHKTDAHAGEVIAIATQDIRSYAHNIAGLGFPTKNGGGELYNNIFAFTVLHGAGHNAGLGHSDDDWYEHKRNTRSWIMNSGDQLSIFGNNPIRDNGFDSYTSPEKNRDYIEWMIKRFNADKPSIDNLKIQSK
jgi:RHS repeat-associated protein